MRFTRKIPGIRPGPYDRDETAALSSGLFSVGVNPGMVFVFLLAILNIYLICTLMLGGYLAQFWLEGRLGGVSLFTVMTTVNLLMIAYACLGYLARPREGRRRGWNTRVGLVGVLVLLGGSQCLLLTWRSTALLDLERAKGIRAKHAAVVQELRTEIATLAGHDWYGEYLLNDRGWDGHLLLTQSDEARFLYQPQARGGESVDGHELPGDMSFTKPLSVQEGRVVLGEPNSGRESQYWVVGWGSRRYLVAPERLDSFLTSGGEPKSQPGVLVRVGEDHETPDGSRKLLFVSR